MTGEASPWESCGSLMIYPADHELQINDKWKENNQFRDNNKYNYVPGWEIFVPV